MWKEAGALAAALSLGFSCGNTGPQPGEERGECRGDGTCVDGLVCASNLCVKPPVAEVPAAAVPDVESPQELLKRGTAALRGPNHYEGERALKNLVNEYPKTPEAEQAKAKLRAFYEAKQEQRERARQAAAELVRQFENQRRVKLKDGLKIKIRNVAKSRKWRFDRYDDRWFELEADKDAQYVFIDFDATAETKDPRLPLFVAFRVAAGGTLKSEGAMRPAFYRWQDYGTYLGNYHDTRNDFAKRDTVRFTAGVQLKNRTLAENDVVVALMKKPCLRRMYERLRNPPVFYDASGCRVSNSYDAENFVQRYEVIHVFRKRK